MAAAWGATAAARPDWARRVPSLPAVLNAWPMQLVLCKHCWAVPLPRSAVDDVFTVPALAVVVVEPEFAFEREVAIFSKPGAREPPMRFLTAWQASSLVWPC